MHAAGHQPRLSDAHPTQTDCAEHVLPLFEEQYPERKVFIDTRVDFYGREFLEEYIKVTSLKPDWREVFARHDIAQVLLPKESPVVTILRADPEWEVVVEGEEEALLVRRGR